ncbi:MAG: Lrp/AsnC family transcriptional regulator, partial [Nanoarchaeota archaeon]|nr:Lrp/AsnC family transcriptional regulator [Nanoarchaeota archaeon]
MYKLDNIDKKIIYEMEKNARLSYRQVAQKIGSKKEIVAYHFNQLLKDKIINKMMPVFSITKLGIYACKIYLKLHGIDKENEKKLYDFLISNKAVSWIARCTGKWD